ncbi:hypothetical protein Y1Q_0017479 [Alligator mississippiensis]|uniref:Uncharacterized protein n=1 Tax=Alligator mississippiensis TaxID=8496 RepID=A0A151P236_ALLMI|nr:hypothetical protein Y1Q_0017479 [Alligator mississippiensis]
MEYSKSSTESKRGKVATVQVLQAVSSDTVLSDVSGCQPFGGGRLLGARFCFFVATVTQVSIQPTCIIIIYSDSRKTLNFARFGPVE